MKFLDFFFYIRKYLFRFKKNLELLFGILKKKILKFFNLY
jgi:hypothetical protein